MGVFVSNDSNNHHFNDNSHDATADRLLQLDTDLESKASATVRSKRDRYRQSPNRHSPLADSRDGTFDDTTTNYTCDDTEATGREGRGDVNDGKRRGGGGGG